MLMVGGWWLVVGLYGSWMVLVWWLLVGGWCVGWWWVVGGGWLLCVVRGGVLVRELRLSRLTVSRRRTRLTGSPGRTVTMPRTLASRTPPANGLNDAPATTVDAPHLVRRKPSGN